MIARKSTLIISFNIISALLSYVALFLVVRFMGVRALGVVGFGIAYVTLFSFIAKLGFGGAHVKRVSEGKDLATCIATYARVKILLIVIMACVIVSTILFWKYLLGKGFETQLHEYVLYITIFYIVFYMCSHIFLHTFSARRETAKFQIPYLTESVSRVAIIVVVVVFGLGILAYAFSYVLGALAMLITAIFLFRSYPFGKYDYDYFKSYLSFALPYFIVSVISVVSVNIDKVMLQLFWSSLEVGYYFSVQRIIYFLITISGAVGILLFPTLSSYHAENRIKELVELSRKAERYISLVIFPLIAFIIALAPQIIHVILSDEILPAVVVFQILAIYALIFSVNCPYRLQFGAIDKPKLGAKIVGVVALLNIGLNIIFIPSSLFGIKLLGLRSVGAALTTVISTFVGVVISRFYVKKLTNTTTNPKIFIHLLAALLTGLLLYLLAQIILLDRFYSLILTGLLCIGIYLAILYCLKEFTKEDYRFFLDTLSHKKMFRYLKEELRQ